MEPSKSLPPMPNAELETVDIMEKRRGGTWNEVKIKKEGGRLKHATTGKVQNRKDVCSGLKMVKT